MPITIVQLGSLRESEEGLRIGAVRRPPRGIPKSEFATRNFYDVWLPNLAPSAELVRKGLTADDERSWRKFERLFRAEMSQPESTKVLDLLAALSKQTNFSLGCYCKNENHCHRSILRQLLSERQAIFVEPERHS